MVTICLVRNLKKKWWDIVEDIYPKYYEDYKDIRVNGYKIIKLNEDLWEKCGNIRKIQAKGYDANFPIGGVKRGGKSTLAKTLLYIFNPDATIDNFASGMQDLIEKIDKAKDGDCLIVDEAVLTFNSREGNAKANIQLAKVIDVMGIKRLILILCIPNFFDLSRAMAIYNSLFLIIVKPDENLDRGNFYYYGKRKKAKIYEIGKRNFGRFNVPPDFNGHFTDFHTDFEEAYDRLKKKSLDESLHGAKKQMLNQEQTKIIMQKVLENYDLVKDEVSTQHIALLFGVNRRTIQTHLRQIRLNSENDDANLYSITRKGSVDNTEEKEVKK